MNTLWEVLSDIKEEADFANDLALFLTGNVDASVVRTIGANGLENNLHLSSFVAHHEAVQRMMSADILLFIILNQSETS